LTKLLAHGGNDFGTSLEVDNMDGGSTNDDGVDDLDLSIGKCGAKCSGENQRGEDANPKGGDARVYQSKSAGSTDVPYY
jgi:hypothetical protein